MNVRKKEIRRKRRSKWKGEREAQKIWYSSLRGKTKNIRVRDRD